MNVFKKPTALIAIATAFVLGVVVPAVAADKPSDLNDLEIAHVAYTADNIDIRYAHLALAKSKNPAIHKFARTMIRDHEAVNAQALALLKKLGAQPQNNFLSRQLLIGADKLVAEMSALDEAEIGRASCRERV